MVAKVGLKKAAKEFVEAQVKKQLARYSKDKWAKNLADDAFSFIDKATATAWWEYVVEVIPIAGDAYSAGKLGKQGYAVWKGLDRIKARVEAVVNTINKTDKLRGALKITDKALEAHHVIPTQLLKENKVV